MYQQDLQKLKTRFATVKYDSVIGNHLTLFLDTIDTCEKIQSENYRLQEENKKLQQMNDKKFTTILRKKFSSKKRRPVYNAQSDFGRQSDGE